MTKLSNTQKVAHLQSEENELKRKEGIQAAKEKRNQQKVDDYLKNLPYCQLASCRKVIPFKKRNQKFCDQSCSAINSNANRTQESRNQQKETRLKNEAKRRGDNTIIAGEYTRVQFRVCEHCRLQYRTKRGNAGNCYRVECIFNRKTTKSQYRILCKFNLNNQDFPKLYDSELIMKYGWYSAANKGNNLSGVSWDHLYRVSDGFRNKIDPMFLSHPANAELVTHTENHSRKESMITLDQLLERIKLWDSDLRDLPKFRKIS